MPTSPQIRHCTMFLTRHKRVIFNLHKNTNLSTNEFVPRVQHLEPLVVVEDVTAEGQIDGDGGVGEAGPVEESSPGRAWASGRGNTVKIAQHHVEHCPNCRC